MVRKHYDPMLLMKATKQLLERGEWICEVKLDGYRMLAYLERRRATLISRHNKDHTARYPTIAALLPQVITASSCVLDGEIVAVDTRGCPSLSLLKRRQGIVQYFVFDLIELNGKPLMKLPVTERRARLRKILKKNKLIHFSEEFTDVQQLWQQVVEWGLEGIVMKRVDSRYCPGIRSQSWLKIKREYFDKLLKQTRHR